MKQDPDRMVALQLSARMDLLPVATQCVETSAQVFGLGREETLKLSLATEEIFSYLSGGVCRREPLDIRCINGLSYTRVEFRFAVSALDMGVLNITASVPCDSDEDLMEMGLMIAARSIDRLNIVAERQNSVCLAIEKDKSYPAAPVMSFAPVAAGGLSEEMPDGELLKRYVARVALEASDPLLPELFHYPGKVADMAAAGECQAVVVLDSAGEIAAGILFGFLTERVVEIHGLHVFSPDREAEAAEMLLNACIARTARTRAIGLVSMNGLPPSIQSQFEILGSLTDYRADGKTVKRPVFYRHLHEDPGGRVWIDASLKDYLQGEYGRLFLARDMREVRDQGETKNNASIISADVYPERSEVILRPLWPGRDFDANVQKHLQFFREEGIRNIQFVIDLGISWHASLIPVLLARQFLPGVILPFAGLADMVGFQYHGTES